MSVENNLRRRLEYWTRALESRLAHEDDLRKRYEFALRKMQASCFGELVDAHEAVMAAREQWREATPRSDEARKEVAQLREALAQKGYAT